MKSPYLYNRFQQVSKSQNYSTILQIFNFPFLTSSQFFWLIHSSCKRLPVCRLVLHHKIVKKKKKSLGNLLCLRQKERTLKGQRNFVDTKHPVCFRRSSPHNFTSNRSTDSRARYFIEYYTQSSTMIRSKKKKQKKKIRHTHNYHHSPCDFCVFQNTQQPPKLQDCEVAMYHTRRSQSSSFASKHGKCFSIHHYWEFHSAVSPASRLLLAYVFWG